MDIAAFVRTALSFGLKESIVAALRHEAFPCPARKLELVVSVPERLPDFELNLNSGEGEHHVELSPERVSAFWFTIDASIVRGQGLPLVGPPAVEVVPELPREQVQQAIRAAIRWQIDNRLPADDLVLNACRSRRYLDESVWSSKEAAGEWARSRLAAGEIVEDALALRRGDAGADLGFERAAAFAASVLDR